MRKDFMDGLRGWASLAVLFSHLGPCIIWAFNQPKFYPVITDGQLAVYVFFVISGFALSIQFFETKSRTNIIKLALRRYPRLTIPILTSCLLTYLMIAIGATYNIHAGKLSGLEGFLGSFFNFEHSISGVLKFSLWDVYFAHDQKFSYNPVLWTMRYEMAGSLLLFALLFVCGANRIGVLALVCTALYLWKSNSILLAFLLGAGLAKAYPALSRGNKISVAFGLAILPVTLWLAMFRDDMKLDSYREMSVLSATLVLCIILLPAIRSFLINRVSQLLGKISFPLYLVNILVISTWTSWLYTIIFSRNTPTPASLSLVAISSTAVAIAAAVSFSPVEQFAIRYSRKFSDITLRLFHSYVMRTKIQRNAASVDVKS